MNHFLTDEDKEKRAQRAALRRKCPTDPLKERVRFAAMLLETAKHWPATDADLPVRSIYRQPGLRRRMALPSVRQHMATREAERRSRHAQEMRESAQRHAQAKALAKAGPMPLFDQAAA